MKPAKKKLPPCVIVSLRVPRAWLKALDGHAKRLRVSRTEVILTALEWAKRP
jgi:hypothetical protein